MMDEPVQTPDVKPYSAEWWNAKLAANDKEVTKKWKKSARTVVDRYLDDRSEGASIDAQRKYNIFWANVQILKSALYATPPKPEVKRQNDDAKDDVGRTAALILQRLLQFGISYDYSDAHSGLDQAVEDVLIPGLGQVWLRYEPTIESVDVGGVKADVIVDEEAPVDYVHWDDFFWSPARTWKEVWWVARRVWMGQEQFTKRFSERLYTELKDKYTEERKTDSAAYPKGFREGKVEVYEIWCRETRTAYWVTQADTKLLLDSKRDPLKLTNFFPCPKPLLATHTTNGLIPRPDYVMMQDQYNELDTLNDRINTLTKALRVVGAYDKNNTELAKMVTGGEFNMIPVENWAMLSEQGGIAKSVDWFPVEQVQKVLAGLVEQRVMVVGQIYELSGISDIMRGASNPRETAKAQTLKAQYSSVRLQLKQQAVGMFVREVLRIRSEIICKHFQTQTILTKSQIEQTESANFAPQAVELLKNYRMTEYRIEVTEQSLSIADYNAERELRMELITSLGQFISQSAAMLKDMPQAMPYMLQIIQWVIASFRGASDVETVLDSAISAMKQMPPKTEPPAPPPPPDKSVEVAQVKAQADLQIADKNNEAALKREVMRLFAERQSKQAELMAQPTEAPEPSEPEGPDTEELMSIIDKMMQPIMATIEMQVKSTENLQKSLEMMVQQIGKPRTRIPVRDAQGNIVEVREE